MFELFSRFNWHDCSVVNRNVLMFVMHFDTMRFWDGSKEESGRDSQGGGTPGSHRGRWGRDVGCPQLHLHIISDQASLKELLGVSSYYLQKCSLLGRESAGLWSTVKVISQPNDTQALESAWGYSSRFDPKNMTLNKDVNMMRRKRKRGKEWRARGGLSSCGVWAGKKAVSRWEKLCIHRLMFRWDPCRGYVAGRSRATLCLIRNPICMCLSAPLFTWSW